ncbi:hypothetical protein H8E88_31890 [candidate division KSB1 bacterium]|nr:hypothetical protein [candidate division KSB1 bacterium]MBL7092688.1 hypothetical protein [candidate division KSB1 bacterium]
MKIENLKNFLSAIREAIIIALFILVLIFPGTFNKILNEAGFTKGSLLGFDWEKTQEETADAAKEVAAVNEELVEIKEQLTAVQSQPVNQRPESYRKINQQVQILITKSEKADRKLKASLYDQQQALQATGRTIKVQSGWLGLGRVKETKTTWMHGNPTTIQMVDPDIKPGVTLILKTDTYLRNETPGQWHSQGKILSVLKVGEKVKVIRQVDYSPAKSGGFYVWAYVER